jgi:hypothetical protein
MDASIAKLLEALYEIVNASGPWQEKKTKILEACGEDDKTHLYEFIAWFE